MRWRRDDRQAPEDRRDNDAESWLSEFRGQSVRPEALTAADRDAAGRRAAQVGDPTREWALYTSEGQVQFNGPLLLQLDGIVKRVEQGPPDSAGPGYRALRVAN